MVATQLFPMRQTFSRTTFLQNFQIKIMTNLVITFQDVTRVEKFQSGTTLQKRPTILETVAAPYKQGGERLRDNLRIVLRKQE